MITIAIIFIVFIILYTIRERIESSKSHKLYKIIDKWGAIQILDNKGLVAILYKDRTVDWIRDVSIYKIDRIKLISDRFEEEYANLKAE